MKRGKKVIATVLGIMLLTLGGASSVLAQSNGYYVNGTEYLFTDVATHPAMIQVLNSALGGDMSKLALDLNCNRANFADFIANGGALTNDSFNAYAAQHPYHVPATSTVYNPADPSKSIVNTDAVQTSLVTNPSATYVATSGKTTLKATVDSTVISLIITDGTTTLATLDSIGIAQLKSTAGYGLIGAANGDILTLTPYVGSTAQAATTVIVSADSALTVTSVNVTNMTTVQVQF